MPQLADRAARLVGEEHACTERRLVQPLLGEPSGVLTLRLGEVADLAREAERVVEGDDELPVLGLVVDDVDGHHGSQVVRLLRADQDERLAGLHRGPELAVGAGEQVVLAVRLVEQPVRGLGIVVGAARGCDDRQRRRETARVPDAAGAVDDLQAEGGLDGGVHPWSSARAWPLIKGVVAGSGGH